MDANTNQLTLVESQFDERNIFILAGGLPPRDRGRGGCRGGVMLMCLQDI